MSRRPCNFCLATFLGDKCNLDSFVPAGVDSAQAQLLDPVPAIAMLDSRTGEAAVPVPADALGAQEQWGSARGVGLHLCAYARQAGSHNQGRCSRDCMRPCQRPLVHAGSITAAYCILRAFSWQLRLSPFPLEDLAAAITCRRPTPLMDEVKL